MKKVNLISQIIMTVILLVISLITIRNEDISWFILIPILLFIITLYSFLSTKIARNFIEKCNRIKNIYFKIIYYILILLIILIFVIGIYYIFETLDLNMSNGLIGLFIITLLFILLMMPYVQSIIIIILTKCLKIK